MVPLRVKIYASLLIFVLALLLSADVPIWGDASKPAIQPERSLRRGILKLIPLPKRILLAMDWHTQNTAWYTS